MKKIIVPVLSAVLLSIVASSTANAQMLVTAAQKTDKALSYVGVSQVAKAPFRVLALIATKGAKMDLSGKYASYAGEEGIESPTWRPAGATHYDQSDS